MPGKVANTFINELANMGVFAMEADAAVGWANAWNTYFTDSVCNAIPINAAILPVAKSAMIGALAGIAGNDGLGVLQAAIVAWWGALSPAASVFTGATAIVPPIGLAGLKSDLQKSTKHNCDNNLSAVISYTNIVNGGVPLPPSTPSLGLHILNLTGALASFPGGIVAPIL